MGGAQRIASSGDRGNDQDGSGHKNQSGGNSLRGKHNRTRASRVRKQRDYRRVINLIDVDNNATVNKRRGRMNGTSHKRVLASLSLRAGRIRNICNQDQDNAPHSWALDKTGTIRMSTIDYLGVEQQEKEEVNNIEVPDEVLQVHGYAPPSKAEGTLHLIYKNMNGLCNQMSNNKKLEKARTLNNELEVDFAAYCEHQLNMKHKANCN